jgi:tyrosine-protein phosphatase OCA1
MELIEIILFHLTFILKSKCAWIGTIVGCLRKLQRWSLTAIFEEYRRYAGSKVRVLNEQVIKKISFSESEKSAVRSWMGSF